MLKWLLHTPSNLAIASYLIGLSAPAFHGWMHWTWIICGMLLMGIWANGFIYEAAFIARMEAIMTFIRTNVQKGGDD